VRTEKDLFKNKMFEVAIFDEIQIAKNQSSKTHRALRTIDANMRLGLTGTPIENYLKELKALFDLVLPGYLPNESAFQELFINPIEKQHNEESKKLLTRLIKPFILRRRKSEVLLDLPEKIEEIAIAELSEEQKELYREVVMRSKQTIMDVKNKEKPINYMHIFSLLSNLKRICDHPALVKDDRKNYQKYPCGKWDLFQELLQEARESGQKIVVFSQYLGMLEIIENDLRKQGIGFAGIKGSTKDRKEQVMRFFEDPKCEVFVASLLAAGVGINLSAGSVVIHYDRWWNPAKENQATDRVHRIGQNRGVQVFKLVTRNTIEEHIDRLIEKKKGLIEETLGRDESDQVKMFSREELMSLMQKISRDISADEKD
jgi:SNF2 family DNA or RNA helicase